MNYEQSLNYIHSAYKFGVKAGLENISKLTELLGNPQNKYKIIHVAGTNGKGSTSNMIHDVLVASGYKVGLFISPYLQEFTERIQINKEHISKESLAKITANVKEKVDIMLDMGHNHPAEFEIVTAIGFKYFEEQNVDFVVLEVGLGGRFDATNVIKNPLLSVITSISLDHTQYLGETLEEIAFEKAGIIKENNKVIIYPQAKNITDVIINQAKSKNAQYYLTDKKDIEIIHSNIEGQTLSYLDKSIFNLDEFHINFLGEYQTYNCLTALKVLEILKEAGFAISSESVKKGLSTCKFAGRFEIISKKPIVIIDGGHNIDGVIQFVKTVKHFFGNKKITLFFGTLKDKNPDTSISYLREIADEIYTLTPNNPRAMKSDELAELISEMHPDIKVLSLKNTNDILSIIDNSQSDRIFACMGSLYMVGDVRSLILNRQSQNS